MATKEIVVQRFSVTSSRPFESVAAVIEAAVGHPNMNEFPNGIAAAQTYAELEKFIQSGLGESGLMEFVRFDPGAVLRKGIGPDGPRMLRFLIGNPLVMKEMAKHVPDAGSYAPVTILIDERPDGVHLSYDTMESLLASYGNEDALKVARDLDAKVERLLTQTL
jgi:uncharacterized protein (DUF302 family)